MLGDDLSDNGPSEHELSVDDEPSVSEDEVIKEMVDEEGKASTNEKKLVRKPSENSSEGQYLGNQEQRIKEIQLHELDSNKGKKTLYMSQDYNSDLNSPDMDSHYNEMKSFSQSQSPS